MRACVLILAAVLAAGFAVLDGRAADTAARAAPRLLYASDWSGTYQVYAVDPSRRSAHGQLTFGLAPACLPGNPCGFVAPLASPDGTKVSFWDDVEGGPWYARLFVARADGSGRRHVATVNHFDPPPTSWSPDSRRIAYVDRDGIRVVSAFGGRSTLVASTRGSLYGDLSWSPRGDWIAYTSSGIRLVSPDGKDGRYVAADGNTLAWSPDGLFLAFAGAGHGIRVYDVRTGSTKGLTTNSASSLAWSPDGKLVAFSSQHGIGAVERSNGVIRSLSPDQGRWLSWSPDARTLAYGADGVKIVGRNGKPRSVVDDAGDYGGLFRGVAWTRPPAAARYRPAAKRSLAVVVPDGLVLQSKVERLVSDGARVAFTACGHVFIWTPALRVVEQAETTTSLSPQCAAPGYRPGMGMYTLALAGDRLAHGLIGGGNTTFWRLQGATLTPLRPGFLLGAGSATTTTPRRDFVGDLVGAGSLLVFSSRDESYAGGACCKVVTARQRIVRAEPGGCPCTVIASEPGPFVPHDIEAGRIAAVGDNAVVLLDGNGNRLLTVDVKARSAQLSGRNLVVHTGERLLDVDASNGNELHAWPLVGSASLQDAARGLAVYVLNGQVHLLRLADGRDEVVAAGTLARFMDAGLVYADGSRLRLVPFDRLPLA
jgi:WD40-like Beta Propeller Repeat